MDNLQGALDKLRADKDEFIKTAQLQVNQQIAWYDGGIAALESILHPKKEQDEPADKS